MSKLSAGKTANALLAVLLLSSLPGAARAQVFTTLHSFDGTDGSNPYAGLLQAANGDFYGTTEGNGTSSYGTVFKITPSGTLTTLYNFCSQTGCTDGQEPAAGLLLATNGEFYGTTSAGGAYGFGTVFKITSSGALTTVYSFCSQSQCTDGLNPVAGLIQATNGDIYGTTAYGGTNCVTGVPFGCGTVFKITPSGTLTTLYSFCAHSGCTDGKSPLAGLIQATNGDFYGTTWWGGANDRGTVFKITPSGTLATLYSFCSLSNCNDGYNPESGLIQATNGDFYGTVNYGGVLGGGTVFRITPSGTLTTLYSFGGDGADGVYPFTGLVQAADGDFYGTTMNGGVNGYGTIFEITPGGTLTTLHSFCIQSGCIDGEHPKGLVQATNGGFIGTAEYGGQSGDGIVFSLSVGLNPFVETLPASGKMGTAVEILGTNLTGATSVTFNGVAAVFTVVAPSLITTTVPAGATSGKVQVVPPGGTLSTNVPFQVLP